MLFKHGFPLSYKSIKNHLVNYATIYGDSNWQTHNRGVLMLTEKQNIKHNSTIQSWVPQQILHLLQ